MMTAPRPTSVVVTNDPIKCWLCEREDRVLYRGLATLGIKYPGGTRFICNNCIDKVKTA